MTDRPSRPWARRCHAAALLIIVLGLVPRLPAQGPEPNAPLPYTVVDTGQSQCYDSLGPIPCPGPNEPWAGQDAQVIGPAPRYRDNGDGTVTDLQTGLMWQQALGEKHGFADAVAGATGFDLAGYRDWRLPTIKELWSLFLYTGSTGRDAGTSIPYLDATIFEWGTGDVAAGERFIDGQTWSATEYGGLIMRGERGAFGVNFVDGRIKCYPRDRARMFVRYVRGNPDYGRNDFVDNGDGTITDRATGLMWMRVDSGALSAGPFGDGRLPWAGALDWAEHLDYAGYDDWHLPNGKELQSLVDYTRWPEAEDPNRRGAALDPIFQISEEQSYFWTSSTHVERGIGDKAAYVAFGQALGHLTRPNGEVVVVDAHGAGAVRSDPKLGNPADWPFGRGPQGDDIRIYNYARCVRRVTPGEPGSPAASRTAPNLIVALADDLGWGDVGYHGSDIRTPTIDRLAAAGVQLDRFYAFPTCSPTRLGLLTGQSPLRSGVTGPLPRTATVPDLDTVFLGQILQDAGYQSWLCGKWHLGGGNDARYRPNARGFDHWYGFLGAGVDAFTHRGTGGRPDWYRNDEPVEESGYVDDLLAGEAVSLVRNRDPNRPFFLLLSFHGVHLPAQAPENVIATYPAELGTRRTYAAMVTALDTALGRVLDAVAEAGLTDNTLVVFLSDNGAERPHLGGGSNAPLRGFKGQVYEGGIRLPAVVAWPGLLPAARVCAQPIRVTDLLPSLVTALGLSAPGPTDLDGVSRWDALRGVAAPEATEFLVVNDAGHAALLRGDWKLVDRPPRVELYDLSADPAETQDRAADAPELVALLRDRLDALR